MINPGDLLTHVVRPTLRVLADAEPRLDSGTARQGLIGTYLTEGVYRKEARLAQVGGGPALGIWQMEPETFDDLVDWLEKTHKRNGILTKIWRLQSQVYGGCGGDLKPEELTGNLYLACAFARLKYWRIPVRLPAANDLGGWAEYWGKYYNTHNNREWKARFVAHCVNHQDVMRAALDDGAPAVDGDTTTKTA